MRSLFERTEGDSGQGVQVHDLFSASGHHKRGGARIHDTHERNLLRQETTSIQLSRRHIPIGCTLPLCSVADGQPLAVSLTKHDVFSSLTLNCDPRQCVDLAANLVDLRC